ACTRWCNCGETPSASAQGNAAETHAAINARPRLVGRAYVLIALRACDLDASCARNFYESLVADVYCDKNPVSGLVAAAALNFSASPISRASRPASIAFLNAFAIRIGSEAIAIAVLTSTASAPISIASAA